MIKVTGLKEVEANLRKLEKKEATKVLRQGMIKATKPIVQAAKDNATAIGRSGALSQAIGSKFVIGKQNDPILLPPMGGRFTVTIGPLLKSPVAIALYNLVYRRRRKKIYHGHFVEFGTKRTRARPFLRPALEANMSVAVNNLAREIQAGIDRLLSKK